MSNSVDKSFPGATDRLRSSDWIVLIGCALLLGGYLVAGGRIASGPPDFAGMPVDVKKREFFAFLSPMISAINFQFAEDRDRVRALREKLERGEEIGWHDRRWLGRLAARLEVDIESTGLDQAMEVLERRAGVIPESIVLVQAAVESGWGTSRFATQGNNYFGQRCYSVDCGMVPRQLDSDDRFGLAQYASPEASVESYMLNLNTHESYSEFRRLRERLREQAKPITGLSLVHSLTDYSERGADYVAQIAAMIRANNLE